MPAEHRSQALIAPEVNDGCIHLSRNGQQQSGKESFHGGTGRQRPAQCVKI
jgi:hypothetical protein